MKLLFDENLSPKLPRLLADLFPGSAHVEELGLGATDDARVWAYAATHDFTIVSMDSDFHARSVLHGFPLKVIWLRTGNCTTSHLAGLLRANSLMVHTFARHPSDAFLILC